MTQFIIAIAGLSILFAAGCNKNKKEPETATAVVATETGDVKKRIKDNIEDKARQKKLILIVDESNRCMLNISKSLMENRKTIDQDLDITAEESEVVLKKIEAVREECIRKIVAGRLELRTLVSADEWNRIFTNSEFKQNTRETLEADANATVDSDAAKEVPAVDSQKNEVQQ
jgi:hypothetical protein